jgi:hypothetical protein
MSDRNLHGKTVEQLEVELAHMSRSQLIGLIHSLATVEQLLKPSEIAARSRLNKRSVLRDIRDGKFGDYYCRAENSLAVPLSGVNKWRRTFRVPAKGKSGGPKMRFARPPTWDRSGRQKVSLIDPYRCPEMETEKGAQ